MRRFANKARGYPPYERLVVCTLATLVALAAPASTTAAAQAAAKRPDQLSPRQKSDAVLAGLDPKKLVQLRAELGRFVADGQIAGAVTVIGRRGRVGSLAAIGFADREARSRMRPDTMFRIAAMTKLITATAVLMLHDESKLSIDDPVAQHLPEFRGQKLIEKRTGNTLTLVDPPRPITIKDLLTHTSGMACLPPAGFVQPPRSEGRKPRSRTLAHAVIALAQQPLERAPGTGWQHCGAGFDILGRLVEVVAQRPFAQFLAQRLWQPLRMQQTTFGLRPAQRKRLATLYRKASSAPEAAVVRADQTEGGGQAVPAYPSPAQGLYSTALDYARFLQMLLDGGSARGRRILRPETAAKMTAVHFSSPDAVVGFSSGLGMGLGVQVVMTPADATEALLPGSFGQGGWLGTEAWADPKNDVFYLLMIQREAGDGADLSDVLRAFQRLGAAAIVKLPITPKPGLFSSRARSAR